MTRKGISAIFGPQSVKTNDIVQSVAETLEIPQFQTFWNPKLSTFTTEAETMDRNTQIFNLFPDHYTVSKALATILKHMRWKRFAIIYENDESLIKLQDILKNQKMGEAPTLMKRLPEGLDYRHVLKEIKESSELQIILDCRADKIINVLEQAKEIKLMEDYHSWFITSFVSNLKHFRLVSMFSRFFYFNIFKVIVSTF